jgi:diaminopimelate decarboxylase
MRQEQSTDLAKIGAPVKEKFEDFALETGRKLHLEIEPGTFLVANAGALVCRVQDKTSTSAHTFLKLDAGMTEVLRPSLYGAQHPLVVIPKDRTRADRAASYVVVGHCCESGDLLTPAPGEADTVSERELTSAEIGDLMVVEGSGAYCAGMSTKNYNSFPEAPEVMLAPDGALYLIRRRQTLEQALQNELDLPTSALA